MDEQLKSNLTSSKQWTRLVYMLLFGLFLNVASFVVTVLVILQFAYTLFAGSNHQKLRTWSYSLSKYIEQGLMFLTFNSENKPFPFAEWPEDKEVKEAVTEASEGPAFESTEREDEPVMAEVGLVDPVVVEESDVVEKQDIVETEEPEIVDVLDVVDLETVIENDDKLNSGEQDTLNNSNEKETLT